MSENVKKYYFSFIKLSCILILIIYYVYSSNKSLHELSVEWFLLAVVLAAALGYELINIPENQSLLKLWQSGIGAVRIKLVLLIVEAGLSLSLVLFFGDSTNGLFLMPIVIWDTVTFLQLSFAFSIFSFIGVFLKPDNIFLYFIYCMFVFIIYFQNYIIIEKYRKYLQDLEQEEYKLKDSIHSQGTLYKEELQKSSLAFENKMLEEKARLSQALHDKLGHSINGSIYQLEACKVLMEKEPQESRKIVQGVIDNLRTSMDEIRRILRREKPDKKRMALLQLVGLCEECKAKYGIQADLIIDGEDKDVPETVWEVILDNTFEAVTNALKYAKCTQITIEIAVLHKVVRCSITDNGVGCITIKEGMGLQGMMSRTRKMNGIIDINSEQGFRINMLLPLEKTD
ncbi:MAG TPA: histidine kinase [Mobilitalea sp.]|nr:histidine kinase [Mobilitalea sp.]